MQQNRQIGHRMIELSQEHRLFPTGRHIIIYRTALSAILVPAYSMSVWIMGEIVTTTWTCPFHEQ